MRSQGVADLDLHAQQVSLPLHIRHLALEVRLGLGQLSGSEVLQVLQGFLLLACFSNASISFLNLMLSLRFQAKADLSGLALDLLDFVVALSLHLLTGVMSTGPGLHQLRVQLASEHQELLLRNFRRL